MSTEDQKKSTNFQSNILKFPGTKNPEVDDQQKEFARLLMSITMKMNKEDWQHHIITQTELAFLSNHGEAIKHPPITASRLISVLAASLTRNSFMEDFLWVEKKE